MLVDHLDKGASLGPAEPCLVMGDQVLSYADVQALSHRVAGALHRDGVRAGDSVAVLSANDPVAFATVFGISRAGAVWCPVNPRNEAEENRAQLELFGCVALVFQAAFAPLVTAIAPLLPALRVLVSLDDDSPLGPRYDDWLASIGSSAAGLSAVESPVVGAPAAGSPHREDVPVMLVGTGGTTGTPKGVVLTDRNLETMSAITLMSYPFEGRPTYLGMAPLTHAAGVLCFPVLASGGRIVVMPKPDVGAFLALVESERVTHTFLPPTVIYAALGHPAAATTDFSSLQCFWYGAAPMSVTRLREAIALFGPVMGQLFGQSEAPMMVTTLSPAEHLRPDGSLAEERLASAGHPGPLVTVGVMAADGSLLPTGERGEIVVRSSLVMAGYHRNPEATAEASAFGWHHTGDIGFLDDDGFLFIVDRAKDMVITGGFNVYSTEVEQALMQHPAVADCAVIGLPDDTWGERVTAVVQLRPGQSVDGPTLSAFVKERLGSVKAPKQVEVWPDLPRSKVGKVLKSEIRGVLLPAAQGPTAG